MNDKVKHQLFVSLRASEVFPEVKHPSGPGEFKANVKNRSFLFIVEVSKKKKYSPAAFYSEVNKTLNSLIVDAEFAYNGNPRDLH